MLTNTARRQTERKGRKRALHTRLCHKYIEREREREHCQSVSEPGQGEKEPAHPPINLPVCLCVSMLGATHNTTQHGTARDSVGCPVLSGPLRLSPLVHPYLSLSVCPPLTTTPTPSTGREMCMGVLQPAACSWPCVACSQCRLATGKSVLDRQTRSLTAAEHRWLVTLT